MAIDSKPAGLVGAAGAVVAFDVYFDPARWHWSKGGKLGGLFVGSGKASGGRHTEDGASHRLMWKAGGGAISYIYVPKGLPQSRPELRASKDFGIGVHADVFAGALKTGQWNHVEIGLRVNTFDASGRPAGDGASSLTINGRTAELAGVNWAARPGTAISGFDFNTFFGGPDPAVVDSIAYVKNFALYEWK